MRLLLHVLVPLLLLAGAVGGLRNWETPPPPEMGAENLRIMFTRGERSVKLVVQPSGEYTAVATGGPAQQKARGTLERRELDELVKLVTALEADPASRPPGQLLLWVQAPGRPQQHRVGDGGQGSGPSAELMESSVINRVEAQLATP